jgi:hypothetical protein
MTSDDILNDEDRSVFDDGSETDGPDEQEIDDDSFEVLSFEAPPESSVYIKGTFLLTHLFEINIILSFRISIYNIRWSK